MKIGIYVAEFANGYKTTQITYWADALRSVRRKAKEQKTTIRTWRNPTTAELADLAPMFGI